MTKNTPYESASQPAPDRRAPAAKGLHVLRLPTVIERTGLSRSSVYRQLGHMRIALGPNAAGWLEHEIEAWISERVAASRGGAEAVEKVGV